MRAAFYLFAAGVCGVFVWSTSWWFLLPTFAWLIAAAVEKEEQPEWSPGLERELEKHR